MGESTAIAVTEKSVAQFVQTVLPNLRNYAVRKYDEEAWAKTAMLCIIESKDLQDCLRTEPGKISLYHALRFAATTGLSLNPQEGKACLVPKGGKVHYWIEKGGMIDLAMETGQIKILRSNAVRAQDRFHVSESFDGDTYQFEPSVKSRGEIIGFFCAIKLKNGESLVHYMTREEVDEHKKRYGQGTSNSDSAWNKSFEGMGIKTVIKMALKRLALPSAGVIEAVQEGTDDTPIPGEWVEVPGVTGDELAVKLKEKPAEGQPGTQGDPPASDAQAAPGKPATEKPATAAPGKTSTEKAAPAQAKVAQDQGSQPAAGVPQGKLDIF